MDGVGKETTFAETVGQLQRLAISIASVVVGSARFLKIEHLRGHLHVLLAATTDLFTRFRLTSR